MTFKVQRFPTGLIDWLGTWGSGRTPSELLEQIRPTVDLGPYFLAKQYEQLTFTATGISAPGDGIVATVPEGEIWAVRLAGGRLQNGDTVGMTFQQALSFRAVDATGSPLPLHQQDMPLVVVTTGANGDRMDVHANFDNPLLAPPGSTFINVLSIATGGASTCDMRLVLFLSRLTA